MDVKEYIDNICKKYNYDTNISGTLHRIIPAIIKYYGGEYLEIILEAINNTEIYCCKENENPNDILNSKCFNKYSGNQLVDPFLKKECNGLYHSEPKILLNDNKYEINKIDRMIILSNFSFNNLQNNSGTATLIHEICHLIKSYKNEYIIRDNVLINRSGINNIEYEIVKNEDGTLLKIIKENNLGIEEAINTYDVSMIMKQSIDKDYEGKDYVVLSEVAKVLKEKFNLNEQIVDEQINNNIGILAKSYNNNSDEDIYSELNGFLDKEVKLNYDRYKNIFDKEATNKIMIETKENLENIKNNFNKRKLITDKKMNNG